MQEERRPPKKRKSERWGGGRDSADEHDSLELSAAKVASLSRTVGWHQPVMEERLASTTPG